MTPNIHKTLKTTIIPTSRRVNFEIFEEMLGKELEIVVTQMPSRKDELYQINIKWLQMKI